jgi:hypothetical protein
MVSTLSGVVQLQVGLGASKAKNALLLTVVMTAKGAASLAEDFNSQQLRLNSHSLKHSSTFMTSKSSTESTWVFQWVLQILLVVLILINAEILGQSIQTTISLDLVTGI